tara:strand:+ start:6018 stop:6812 length:795 start_codon:yes stop_codon:yes gene_type:complete
MLESTLFPVKEMPAYWEQTNKNKGNGTSVREMATGYKFIIREDTNEVLSCMTNDYRMVTNKEIIDTAVPILKKHKAELKESVVLAHGRKTVYKWIIPDYKIRISKDDVLNPEIIINNSYDGSLQVHILGGAFRIVCSNGLVIGVTFGKGNFRHNVNNINLEHLDEKIEKTIERTSKMANEFELLSDTSLNERHIMKLVELFPTQMSEFIVQYLIANKPKTYWDLLNCGTYIASHKMKRNYQTTHKLESQLFGSVNKWAKATAKA